MNAIKPVTPLPWKVDGSPDHGTDIGSVNGVGDYSAFATTKQDATYIVTACNIYPKLVEALREAIGGLHRTGNAYTKGEVLLRELGEGE